MTLKIKSLGSTYFDIMWYMVQLRSTCFDIMWYMVQLRSTYFDNIWYMVHVSFGPYPTVPCSCMAYTCGSERVPMSLFWGPCIYQNDTWTLPKAPRTNILRLLGPKTIL